MTDDAQLSTDFRLSSAPCWDRATVADALAFRWTALNILQPTADRWGPLAITSWRHWTRDNCRDARTGDHGDGGTVDFVPRRASIARVANWMAANLRGRYGSLINERDHIHVTRPGIGVRPGTSEYLNEPTEGVYVAASVAPPALVVAAFAVGALYFLSQT